MKYCPYCGAVLLDSTVSFCSECGKALREAAAQFKEQIQTETAPESEVPAQSVEQPAEVRQEAVEPTAESKSVKGKSQRKKTQKNSKKSRSRKKYVKATGSEPDQIKREDGYDGYYDDVCPADEGRQRDGMDQELIKKIILLAVSALLVVGACVAMMYLL